MLPTVIYQPSVSRRVVVVGAGIMGLLAALRLARAGCGVVVVDRGNPGSGSSGATVPWLNASGKRPRGYFDFCVDSLAEWQVLATDHAGTGDWLHRTGNLHWTDDPEWHQALMQRAQEHAGWGQPAVFLTPEQARRLEPNVSFDDALEPLILYPDEGYLDVPRCFRDLLQRASAAGVRFVLGSPVTTLTTTGDRIASVRLDTGQELPLDVLMVAAGIDTNAILAQVGASVPLVEADEWGNVTSESHRTYRTIHGLVTEVQPDPAAIRRILHAPGVTLMPNPDGGLLVHAPAANDQVTLQTPLSPETPAVATALARAVRAVPGLAGYRATAARLGKRPIPLDGLPAAGRISEVTNCYVAVSHSAFCVAPLLAKHAVDDIVAEKPTLPADFDCRRFDS